MTPTPSIPPDRTPPTLSREDVRDIQQRPMLPDQGFGFGLATMTPQERESLCSLALSALEAREAATWQHGKCVHCGAPQLKDGQQHAIVNPPRPDTR